MRKCCVLFFLIRIVNLLSRRLSLSLSRKRLALERETKVIAEGLPSKTVLEPISRRRTPQVSPCKQHQNVCGAERRHRLKAHFCRFDRPDQALHKNHQGRRQPWNAEIDDARLIPEFDAVHAWPRDRVIIGQMVVYLARKKLNVLVDVEELETQKLSSTGAEGIMDVSAWNACGHEGRRRFVAMQTKEATLVDGAGNTGRGVPGTP